MMVFYNTNDVLSALAECSDIMDEIHKYSAMERIHFGLRDAEGGYGWHVIMFMSVTIVGRRCTRPGCFYDETKPTRQLIADAAEWEKDHVLPHRHNFGQAEMYLGGWYSDESKTLRDFLEGVLDNLKKNYTK